MKTKTMITMLCTYIAAAIGFGLSCVAYFGSGALYGKAESAMYVVGWIIIFAELIIIDLRRSNQYLEAGLFIVLSIVANVISWSTRTMLVTGKLSVSSLVIVIMVLSLIALSLGHNGAYRACIGVVIALTVYSAFVFPADNILQGQMKWCYYFSELTFYVTLFIRSFNLNGRNRIKELIDDWLKKYRNKTVGQGEVLFNSLLVCAVIYLCLLILVYPLNQRNAQDQWSVHLFILCALVITMIYAKGNGYKFDRNMIAAITICCLLSDYSWKLIPAEPNYHNLYTLAELFMVLFSASDIQRAFKYIAFGELMIKSLALIEFFSDLYARTFYKGMGIMLIEMLQVIILALLAVAEWEMGSEVKQDETQI